MVGDSKPEDVAYLQSACNLLEAADSGNYDF
jgi:hypothetical protein